MAYRAHRPRNLRAGAAVVAVLLAVALGACGGDDEADGPPADCTRIEDGAFTLVAQNLAWNTDCLVVDQGTAITFTVDNRDQGVQHNLNVFGPSGKAKTELEAGPVTQTLDYDAGKPGYHQFVCDIHPSMEGDLWVEPTGGG